MAGRTSASRADQPQKAAVQKASADSAKFPAPPASAQLSPTQLNQLIHERTRLAIVSALAVNSSLTFSQLKSLLQVSDGNLSVHARKLEDAGYLACSKSFAGRTPRTEYRLTTSGRRALDKYLNHMEALIRASRET